MAVEGLRRSYGHREVVRGVDFCVNPDEIVVLLGPNGCGKTTLVEMALGLRRRDGGNATIFGLDPRKEPRLIARRLGVQLQGAQLHARLTLAEHFTYVGALCGKPERVRSAVEKLGLSEQLPVQFGHLSGGQQRRALVAVAPSAGPELVVLDEPTSGVDPESRSLFWSVIRAQVSESGLGVLTTTHDLSEAARYATRLLIMRNGQLVANGSPDAIVESLPFSEVWTLQGQPAMRCVADGDLGFVIEQFPDELILGCDGDQSARLEAIVRQAQLDSSTTRRPPAVEDAYLYAQREPDHV